MSDMPFGKVPHLVPLLFCLVTEKKGVEVG